MTEVKPATVLPIDDGWLRFAAILVEKPCPCCDADGDEDECQHEIGCRGIRGLLARIESDRAEIARLKAEVELLSDELSVAAECYFCKGTGCPICHGTGRAR